jgi:hypothetical protein
MLLRVTARALLVCYGVIALWGQGLHEFLDDDGCGQANCSIPAAVAPVQVAALVGEAGQGLAVHSPSGSHVHDCDNCPICQFQALGQHFIAAPPTTISLAASDNLSAGSIEPVHCPALFSPAQPRAPPVA